MSACKALTPGDLARRLLDRYKIYTRRPFDGAGVHGVRVTPQVYTSTADLDTFVHALQELADSGRAREAIDQ